MSKEVMQAMAFKASKEMQQKIKQIARERDISKSAYIREIISPTIDDDYKKLKK